MFGFDDLYYLDERLIPGKTTRDEALAVLGEASGRIKYLPNKKRFLVLVRRSARTDRRHVAVLHRETHSLLIRRWRP